MPDANIAIIIEELEHVCRLTSSDFCALSIMDIIEQRIRWRYAIGNRSERYKQMTLKPGSGPAGIALRTGRPVIWNDPVFQSGGRTGECPLMTAEQLHCAAAFPIMKENRIFGILLIGRRRALAYEDIEMYSIHDSLHSLTLRLTA